MGQTIAVVSASAQLESFLCFEIMRLVNGLRLDDTYDVVGGNYAAMIKPHDVLVLDLPYHAGLLPVPDRYLDFVHGESELSRLQLFKDRDLAIRMKAKACTLIGLLPDSFEADIPVVQSFLVDLVKEELDFVVRKGVFDSLDLHSQLSGILKQISGR